MEFLKFIGALVFIFFFCYLVAAMGNNGFMGSGRSRDGGNLGCAIILFVGFLIVLLLKVIF